MRCFLESAEFLTGDGDRALFPGRFDARLSLDRGEGLLVVLVLVLDKGDSLLIDFVPVFGLCAPVRDDRVPSDRLSGDEDLDEGERL